MASHIEVGRAGEVMAAEFILNLGYRILEKNWRSSYYEVDIIAMDGDILVFIEVKFVKDLDHGTPEENVTNAKERFLEEAADDYIYAKNYEGEIRFDIIAIRKGGGQTGLLHIKDAFFPGV